LLLLVFACSKRGPGDRWLADTDLIAHFPHATVRTETSMIDFGTLEARRYLTSGWSQDQLFPDQSPFVWSIGSRSTLRFELTTVRDLPVRFRCRPAVEKPRVDSLIVELNGGTVTSLALESRLASYRLVLPADRLLSGNNSLTFYYGWPASEGKEGQRVPTVAWFSLELGSKRSRPGKVTVDREQKSLFLPYGSRVDFPLALAAGAELRAESVELEGGTSPRLTVNRLSAAGQVELALFAPGEPWETVSLGGENPDAVLLSLRAESEEPWRAGDGVHLRAPTIWVPARETD
jgi:hypothetical protein